MTDDMPGMVLFGMYQGCSPLALLEDPLYAEWFLGQPDMRGEYPELAGWLEANEDTRLGVLRAQAACVLEIIAEHEDDDAFIMRDLLPVLAAGLDLPEQSARHLLSWLEYRGSLTRVPAGGKRIHYMVSEPADGYYSPVRLRAEERTDDMSGNSGGRGAG